MEGQPSGRSSSGPQSESPAVGMPVATKSLWAIFRKISPVEVFRQEWLQNHPDLIRAVNQCDLAANRKLLNYINLRRSDSSGDMMAFLTFNSQVPAELCIQVILNWRRPVAEGGWEPLKVKRLVGGS